MRRLHVLGVVGSLAATVVVVSVVARNGSEDEGLSCTLAGCDSAITISAPDLAYAPGNVRGVRICIDGRCRVSPRLGPGWIMQRGVSDQRLGVPVNSELLDRRGRAIASDTHIVKRERIAPNGERCGPVCLAGAVQLGADGRLRDPVAPERLRLPSSRPGRPGADVIVNGRVVRLGERLPPPRAVSVASRDALEIRTDARSYVRVFRPGHRPTAESDPFELSTHGGRVWNDVLPSNLRGLRYMVVRLDRRADHRVIELRLPITVNARESERRNREYRRLIR
ncbi:MAG: hypothetical protein WKF42_02200 [Solirubrobacteraceae bacterium]